MVITAWSLNVQAFSWSDITFAVNKLSQYM